MDGPKTLQGYYSVNVTGANFTQAQLSSYDMMLESSNATNSGNVTQASSSGLQQPFAQIQQFNQDTGNGPICCNIAGSSPGVVSASTTGTDVPTTDDSKDSATTNEYEENNDYDDGSIID